jgi:hypothetical protein
VLVSVSLTSQSEENLACFEEAIVLAPEVMSCFLMTGDADYSLRVVVPDLESYQQFMTRTLTRIPCVAHIKSSFRAAHGAESRVALALGADQTSAGQSVWPLSYQGLRPRPFPHIAATGSPHGAGSPPRP